MATSGIGDRHHDHYGHQRLATIVTRGPGGQLVVAPDAAAGVEALRAMVGKIGGQSQGLSQLISPAIEQATGQPPAETFGRPEESGYVQGGGQAFGAVDPQAFQRPGGQPDEQK